ncbi:MAG TPA: DNA helicase RecG, partial [Thermoanaerobaculia bacterium]
DSVERLKLFEAARDGFEVAERDLALRGPGEFLGTKQSGVPRFRFGNIVRDHDLMEKARDAAIALIDKEGLVAAEETARRMIGVEVGVIRD